MFEPLYYKDRLMVINPRGDVGVTPLWNTVYTAHKVLVDSGVDVSPETSRIAVLANLYGNGLPHMLRNLLYNPQICHIVIFGNNLSGSREWLLNFFKDGLEEVVFLGAKAFRIIGTERIIDGEVRPEQFFQKIQFATFGALGAPETRTELASYFDKLTEQGKETLSRIEPPPIPEPVVTRFPSEPRSHTIVRTTPMEAWTELIFRLYRFGHRNTVAKSSGHETRIELQNVHVVIERPLEESDDLLKKYGFGLEKFRDYQRRILDSVKPEGLHYSYGNRLRGYFKHMGSSVDSLEICAERLRTDQESRHAYVALWDNSRDLPEGRGCPCFVSCFFRKFEDKLTLTATFRVHNAMDAWPENIYGLMVIQQFVAEKIGMECGAITVVSHSISIDPSSLSKAKKIMEEKTTDQILDSATGKLGPRFDPNGEFIITIDDSTSELVVQHSFQGMNLAEYRGKSAEEIELQLARDNALSVISHALYLGRELARKEAQMKVNRRK